MIFNSNASNLNKQKEKRRKKPSKVEPALPAKKPNWLHMREMLASGISKPSLQLHLKKINNSLSWKEKKESAAWRWCDPINATLVVLSFQLWEENASVGCAERESEGEKWKRYCLQASWDATQFHSFTNEWHSIWMQPLWQPLCITTYQRWYSQSDSILVQHYVKRWLRMTASSAQHQRVCREEAGVSLLS